MKLWTKESPDVPDWHPDEDMLLLAMECELPAAEAVRVEQHVGNCWTCRARSEEIRRGILAFVEYREKRYLPSISAPPNQHRDFTRRLRRREAEDARLPIRHQVSALLEAALFRRRTAWIAASFAVLTALTVWIWDVAHPAVVSAAELLSRAEASQRADTSQPRTSRLVAHQKVRMRSETRTVVREFEWPAGGMTQQVAWSRNADPLEWNAPLTAEGFARWRASLPSRTDEVWRSGDLLMLKTTARSGEITEARMAVRASDFHPIREDLQFSGSSELEITEIAFEFRESYPATQAVRVAVQPVTEPEPSVPADAAPAEAPPSAGPTESELANAELRLRYQLSQNGWDVGEDFSISRAGGRVRLSGLVSSDARAVEMRETLAGTPNLDLAIQSPGEALPARPMPQAPAEVPAGTVDRSEPPLLRTLEEAMPAEDDRRLLINNSLAASDAALARAWVLRRLAERYTDADLRLLSAQSRGDLLEMIRANVAQLEQYNARLQPFIDLLPAAAPADATAFPSWRAAVLSLFAETELQDRLVTHVLAGSGATPLSQGDGAVSLVSTHARLQSTIAEIAARSTEMDFFIAAWKNEKH